MSNYLTLCNNVLRKLNLPELSVETFDSARDVHAAVKDAVNDAIEQINKDHYKWPFNSFENTITLQAGVTEYGWPSTYQTADWDTFFLQKSTQFNTNTRRLVRINRDEWYRKQKALDDDAGSAGRSVPDYVFESHGNGFGVTPVPNAAYVLKFRYYANPPRLVHAEDQTTIPSQYDYVIEQGALVHMYTFFDNVERVGFVEERFRRQLAQMRSILISRDNDVVDGRMRF